MHVGPCGEGWWKDGQVGNDRGGAVGRRWNDLLGERARELVQSEERVSCVSRARSDDEEDCSSEEVHTSNDNVPGAATGRLRDEPLNLPTPGRAILDESPNPVRAL